IPKIYASAIKICGYLFLGCSEEGFVELSGLQVF
ncbi:unnamed protein product, partial [marine sediment metagenome]